MRGCSSGSLHEVREGAPVKTQAKKGSNGPVRHSLAGSARRSRRGQLQRLHCRSVLFLGRRGPRRGLRLSPIVVDRIYKGKLVC